MEKVFPAMREISPAAAKTDIVNPLLKDEYPPLLPTTDGANTAVNDSTISVTKDNNDIVKTTVVVASQNNPVNLPNDSSLRRSQQPLLSAAVVACPNCSNQQLQQQQSSDSKQLPSTSINAPTQQQMLCNSMASDKNSTTNNKQQNVKGNAPTTYMPPPGVSSSQIVNDNSNDKCKPNMNCVQGTLNSSEHKISSTNRCDFNFQYCSYSFQTICPYVWFSIRPLQEINITKCFIYYSIILQKWDFIKGPFN